MRVFLVTLLILGAGAAGIAQTPRPTPPAFEVASVKPTLAAPGMSTWGFPPGGKFVATNNSLRSLIQNAYDLGVSTQRRTGLDPVRALRHSGRRAGQYTPDQILAMLQTLLAERFRLVIHREATDTSVYVLVRAASDGKPGPQLKPSRTDCAALRAGRGAATPERASPFEARACTALIFGKPGDSGRTVIYASGGTTLAELARSLTSRVGRPVVDRTGLAGDFEFNLTWLEAPTDAAGASDGPSLFTALQEQLGLKLESSRESLDVVVIDSVERPTPD